MFSTLDRIFRLPRPEDKVEAHPVVQINEHVETVQQAPRTQGTKSVVATAFLIPALDLDGLEFTEFLTLPTGSCMI
eukprot:jgi/Botrbrau1/21536/Bobra.174_2s0039.1